MPYTANPDNLGPALLVITFLCLVISILVVFARLGTKLWLQRQLGIDDLIIGLSVACSIAQSVLVSREVTAGLGQRSSTLTGDAITTILKYQYAANLLYIVSVALAKISVLIFVLRLSPMKSFRWLSMTLMVLVSISSLITFLVLAFQCSLPDPWNYLPSQPHKCLDRTSLWTVVETINGALDLAIVILPTVILVQVQTTVAKRVTAISMFACRLVVLAIIVPEIIFIRQALESTDILYEWWKPVLMAQLIVAASISCSSMPYLKPFLDSLESGLLRADDGRRHVGMSKYGSKVSPRYGSHFSQEVGVGRGGSKRSAVPMKRMSLHRQLGAQNRNRSHSTAESDGSESKIIQTRTFEVVSEPMIDLPIEQQPHAL